jgi:hypothetical protein
MTFAQCEVGSVADVSEVGVASIFGVGVVSVGVYVIRIFWLPKRPLGGGGGGR